MAGSGEAADQRARKTLSALFDIAETDVSLYNLASFALFGSFTTAAATALAPNLTIRFAPVTMCSPRQFPSGGKSSIRKRQQALGLADIGLRLHPMPDAPASN